MERCVKGIRAGESGHRTDRRRRDHPRSSAVQRACLPGSGSHGIGPVADTRTGRNARPRRLAAAGRNRRGGCAGPGARTWTGPGWALDGAGLARRERRGGACAGGCCRAGGMAGSRFHRCRVHSRRDDGKFRPRNLHGGPSLVGGNFKPDRVHNRDCRPSVEALASPAANDRRSPTCRTSREEPAGAATTVAAVPAQCVPAFRCAGALSTTRYLNPMCRSEGRHA